MLRRLSLTFVALTVMGTLIYVFNTALVLVRQLMGVVSSAHVSYTGELDMYTSPRSALQHTTPGAH